VSLPWCLERGWRPGPGTAAWPGEQVGGGVRPARPRPGGWLL